MQYYFPSIAEPNTPTDSSLHGLNLLTVVTNSILKPFSSIGIELKGLSCSTQGPNSHFDLKISELVKYHF